MQELAGPTTRDETDRAPTVDLAPLVGAIRRGVIWLGIGVMTGVAGGLFGWRMTGVSYDAVATVAVTPPRSGPASVPPSSTASYVALIRNHSVVANALAQADLTPAEASVHPAVFMSRSLMVEELPGTNLIRIRVRQGDPGQAVKVAHAVAVGVVELSRSVSQQEGVALRDRLESQLKDAADRLRTSEQDLLTFRRSSQIELVRTEVDSLVEQQGKLAGIVTELSGAEARFEAAARELAARPSTLSLSRTIDQTPALMEVARTQSGNDLRSLLGVGLRSEEPNPAYLQLDEEVALGRAEAAELAQMRQQIVSASSRLRQSGTLTELYEMEIELARREADVELSRRLYDDVAARYEQARVVVTSGSAQLQIVDDAVALPEPVSWPLAVWVMTGILIGFVVPLGLICVMAALGYARIGTQA